MRERPILFSGPMVRALLDGSKTQTRRMVKHPALKDLSYIVHCGDGWWGDEEGDVQALCPHGQPGDRLWVRESWMDTSSTGIESRDPHTLKLTRYAYMADTPAGSYADQCRKDFGLKWKPSIHMPRAACRITLEITGVRVERLQDISDADARAEGMPATVANSPRVWFASLWESINGPGSWDANPWVWVVEFKREANHG